MTWRESVNSPRYWLMQQKYEPISCLLFKNCKYVVCIFLNPLETVTMKINFPVSLWTASQISLKLVNWLFLCNMCSFETRSVSVMDKARSSLISQLLTPSQHYMAFNFAENHNFYLFSSQLPHNHLCLKIKTNPSSSNG